MNIANIPTNKIIIDSRTQPRAIIDEYVVNEYRLDMNGGDDFPPLMVFGENGSYYLFAMQYCVPDVPRSEFVAAVNAEGIPLWEGYVKPIYLEPMYRHKRPLHKKYMDDWYTTYKDRIYPKGLCPVTERMHFEELIYTNVIHAGVTVQDLDDVAAAFGKVYDGLKG